MKRRCSLRSLEASAQGTQQLFRPSDPISGRSSGERIRRHYSRVVPRLTGAKAKKVKYPPYKIMFADEPSAAPAITTPPCVKPKPGELDDRSAECAFSRRRSSGDRSTGVRLGGVPQFVGATGVPSLLTPRHNAARSASNPASKRKRNRVSVAWLTVSVGIGTATFCSYLLPEATLSRGPMSRRLLDHTPT